MKKKITIFVGLLLALFILDWGIGQGLAQSSGTKTRVAAKPSSQKIKPAERRAAAARMKKARSAALYGQRTVDKAVMDPGGIPHYFGPYPNYANSPMPKGPIGALSLNAGGSGYTSPTVLIVDAYGTGTGATATATVAGGVVTGVTLTNPGTGYTAPQVFITDLTGADADASAVIGPPFTGGIRKFFDRLPGLNAAGANLLNQYIPVAIPNKTAYPGSDYYEIEVGQYEEKLHTDLPVTTLRGYRQTNTADATVNKFHHLGPLIIATRNTPVRIKFTNSLPTGMGGDLFIPVDTTLMGAGMGPVMGEMFPQNRATVHLHGGFVPWISDGTPHQWITPATETTSYPQGVSVVNVPDMADPGPGSMTFYYNNQQSARLMFFHDHSFGITRLNVYAGEAAGYLLTDQVEKDLMNGTNVTGVNPNLLSLLPGYGTPLIIQDKSFVDEATIASQDPTWNSGTMPPAPNTGDLWMPHVYMPNQNPYDLSGINAFGRWHYGPWFWPPTSNITHGPIANPYAGTEPWEGALIPGTPNPSMAMEAFMDTPLVNGTLYPYMDVEPKAYRFRILNAANDRFFNLQMYVADPAVTTADGRTDTEVKLVPAAATPGFPADWPKDGREGGVPDPATMGPDWIQIGTEGGFLPAPVVIPNQPIGWNLNATNFNFGNVNLHSLLLGPAERADVIVDFSAYAGQTLILYNDAPAAFPALDPRYDYYTGNPDQVTSGGTPTTQAGFGPNTRTVMQIRVAGTAAAAYPLASLRNAFAKTATKRGVFEVSQDPIIIPQASYNSAYDGSFPVDTFARIADNSKTFQTLTGSTVTVPFEPKAIQDEMGEAFDTEYGRMSGFLGVELPVGSGVQKFTLYPFISPPIELVTDNITPLSPVAGDGTQIWKITHNGVDTHPIHFHLFNVQLINRVAWDNAVIPPDPNEIGWKETVRVNPLEDTIVALRPIAPTQPFKVPNSVRPIDVLSPVGTVLAGGPGGYKDPAGNPVTIVNHEVNFGWEYVWHCHILGHEEMDMMHALAFAAIPEAPSSLTATAVAGPPLKAELAWTDNSLNETGFTVHRANDAAFTAGLTAFALPKDAVAYTDSTIVDNQAYYYRVFANNVIGDTETPGFPTKVADSAFSNTATLGQGAPVPAPPTNLAAVAISGTEVGLTWVAPAGTITGFRIERSTDGGATWPFTFSVPNPAAVSYNDLTAQPLTTYAYRAFATSASGDSASSNIATVTTPQAPPAAPSNLTARLNTTRTRVILNWADNSNNENGFYIQRRAPAGVYATVATVGAGVRTYTDAGVVGGNTYQYQVLAFRTNGGTSTPSNEVSITVPSRVPVAPANLRVARTYRRTVTLAWQDLATNERGVYIERSTNGVTFTRVRTITNPNIVRADVQNLTPNTLYYFRVQYYNRYGASAYSNVVSATTLP